MSRATTLANTPKSRATQCHGMPTWGWVLVALLGFAALQLLALRYALRQEDADAGSHAVGPYAVDSVRFEEPRVDDAEPTGEGRQCPRCGAENRPGFTYCRNCVGFLTG